MKYFSIVLCLFLCLNLKGQKNDSPYLEVLTEGANIPLKATYNKVHIAGTIAHVQVTQVYHNLGNEAIEAKYIFPLSTQAAVHKMHMTVGDRTIHAKIFEKQEAQQVYQQAVNDGKRAAKLDQSRPNVFQMNVGNIMPGDEVSIDLYYTELLVPVAGAYQFVLPSVVGPRFTGESTSGETTFNAPYTKKGIADSFKYDLAVTINAGMMIQEIASNSHQIDTHYPQPEIAEISLSDENKNPANRDFILNYHLRGSQIKSGLLLYEHGDEKFFAYMMEPLKTPQLNQIPPREYLFIVDVSGSMNGYPLEVSKKLMKNLLCNLRETDVFNVLLFASSSTTFKPEAVAATGPNVEAATRFLSEGQGGGGTQLLSALKRAYDMPRKFESTARSMVVITDGYVSIEREAFELISSNLDQANVFTFGIGSSVNRYLIEGMAKVAHGASFIATTKEEAFKVAKKFEAYIATPLLTQVKFKAEGFDVYDVAPSSIPDVFSSRPIVVYGKWKGEAKGKLVVTGYQGSGEFKKAFPVANGTLSKNNQALRYLWARKKIEQLDDYHNLFNTDSKQEVTELGLSYNLLTRYTSFVAVDPVIANQEGKPKLVKQPLPMPQHVDNMAVGAAAEVTASSKYITSFKTEVIAEESPLLKTEERQLKMWLRANFAELVKESLISYDKVRIHCNANGDIVKIEVLDADVWNTSHLLMEVFNTVYYDSIKVKKAFTITLSK